MLYTLPDAAFDPFHVLLLALTAVVLAPRWCWPPPASSLAWCLLVLCARPWVTVVGYELHGYEHNARRPG